MSFVVIRTVVQPVVLCGSEHAQGSRKVPVEGLENSQMSFYCRFHVFFLKSLLLNMC